MSYKRTISFNDKLTIISGDKTSGKSLVLSLIDYCLGKKSKIDLTVQKELDAYCDQAFLEIKINDETITLNRLLKERQTKISIYFCAFEDLDEYTPKTLGIKEVMEFLMRKLNINEYKIIKHQKHSNKKELETISYRDIFRYVYINQHVLGTNNFLENNDPFKRYKNPHAFKLMFNLVEVDKDALNEQLVSTENEIEKTSKEISGLNSYLKDKDAEDRIQLQAKSERFNKNIEEQKQAKIVVIQNSKSNNNNENEMYIKLKKDLEEIANEIYDYQREKKQLQLSINSKKMLVEEYKVEQAEVNATLEVNYELVISDQNIECPLCNSTVQNHTHEQHKKTNPEKMLHNVKKEITNKITLVTNLLTNEIKSIEEIDKKIKRLTRKQAIFDEAILEFVKETDVPFLSQIDSINSMINRLIKDHEMVKEGLRIHHKIDEKNKHIADLESTVIRLKGELKALQVSEDYREEVFKFLNTQYKDFMTRLKYKTDGETFIHPEKYIPYFEGASVYEHESGGLLECMQLSYLGSILNSKTEGYAPGHPGFLLLDSISKYLGTLKKDDSQELNMEQNQPPNLYKDQSVEEGKGKINDPEVYEELYEILIELSESYQIILVENTPPKKVDKYTKYTFLSGEKGLIDIAKNDFSEED
nr:hypothetical protein [Fictibacillus sp. 7GRE50]